MKKKSQVLIAGLLRNYQYKPIYKSLQLSIPALQKTSILYLDSLQYLSTRLISLQAAS
jgi:hypothetical protein